MKALKTIFALGLVICLVVIGCSSVAAVNTSDAWYYNFTMNPPYPGSLRYTGEQQVTTDGGNAAYVTKTTHTAETSYVLSVKEGSTFRPSIDPFVSDQLTKKSGTGTFPFTYKSGYGGRGQKYYLSVYPSNYNFSKYDVCGYWNT